MKTHHLLIPKNIILPISILGFIFTVIGTLLKLSHWSFGIFTPNLVLSISIVFSLFAIFVVLLDIIKNPITDMGKIIFLELMMGFHLDIITKVGQKYFLG